MQTVMLVTSLWILLNTKRIVHVQMLIMNGVYYIHAGFSGCVLMLDVSATTTSSSKEISVFLLGLNVSLPACALTRIRNTWDRLGIGRFPEIHARAVHKRRERSKRSVLKCNPRKATWFIRL